MTSPSSNRWLVISQKIFQQLLCLYPKLHRHEYGAAMAQLFRDQSRDAWNESRGWGLAKLWLRTLPDLGKTSLIERISNFNQKKSMTAKMPSLFRPTPLATFFGVFTVVFLLVLIASIAITFILPESYASTARMQVNSDTASTNAPYDPYFMQTTCEIVQSEVVLSAVVERLNLNVIWGKKFFNDQTFRTSESTDILRGRIQVAPVRNTKILAVTVYSDDPKEAAQIANAIVDAYTEYRVTARRQLTEKGLAVLAQQFDKQTQEIQAIQGSLDKLRAQFKIQTETAADHPPQQQPYWDEKLKLDSLTDQHQLFYAKMEADKMDARLPKTAMVQPVDLAVPGRTPVKPNKPLNIFLGAVAGGFLGLITGALSAFAAAKWNNRGRKNPASV